MTGFVNGKQLKLLIKYASTPVYSCVYGNLYARQALHHGSSHNISCHVILCGKQF